MVRAHTFGWARTVLNLLVLAYLVAFALATSPYDTAVSKGGENYTAIIGGGRGVLAAAQATEIARHRAHLADSWRRWTSEYSDGWCPVPARTCRRFACWNTSGLYLCNDNPHAIRVFCADSFDRFAKIVAYDCCRADRFVGRGGSGQIVTDQGYRVVVAYANCRHGRDDDVPGTGGENPNGACRPGTPMGGPCDPGSERNCARRKKLSSRFVGGYYWQGDSA
ncbi:hypothetical protein RB600_008814 [Gaeumannomyces tritici]